MPRAPPPPRDLWTDTFVNGSAVALLAFLFLLNLTQVLLPRVAPGRGPTHSVLGMTAHSAVGLLGLLLFINILRVGLTRGHICLLNAFFLFRG